MHTPAALLTDPRRRVFLDVETTGLSPSHQATEVAWWDLDTDAHGVFIPAHTLVGADPVALEIQQYWDRRIPSLPVDDGAATKALWNLFYGDGTRAGRAAIVAANPGFDGDKISAVFDRAGLTPEPFYHRKLNVSEAAYWLCPGYGLGNTPGLKDVADLFGLVNPHPHEALSDVRTGVIVYRLLERIRATGRTGLNTGVINDHIISAEIARASNANAADWTVNAGARS